MKLKAQHLCQRDNKEKGKACLGESRSLADRKAAETNRDFQKPENMQGNFKVMVQVKPDGFFFPLFVFFL